MRRQIPLEPWSRSALWSRHIAVFAAVVAAMAVALARLRVIDGSAALEIDRLPGDTVEPPVSLDDHRPTVTAEPGQSDIAA